MRETEDSATSNIVRIASSAVESAVEESLADCLIAYYSTSGPTRVVADFETCATGTELTTGSASNLWTSSWRSTSTFIYRSFLRNNAYVRNDRPSHPIKSNRDHENVVLDFEEI